jgi:hypothetical protein
VDDPDAVTPWRGTWRPVFVDGSPNGRQTAAALVVVVRGSSLIIARPETFAELDEHPVLPDSQTKL